MMSFHQSQGPKKPSWRFLSTYDNFDIRGEKFLSNDKFRETHIHQWPQQHRYMSFLPRRARVLALLGILVSFYLMVWNINSISTNVITRYAIQDGSIKHEDSAYGYKRENATLFMLVRNRELQEALRSMREIEDRFNHKFNYPWTFMNDEPFTKEFIKRTSMIASGKVEHGLIPRKHWDVPEHINMTHVQRNMTTMAAAGIIYGDNLSYRQMCRYNSGFFFREKLMEKYDWYWRVEPGVNFFCDLPYDPFKFMRERNKVYGWVIAFHEFERTIPTLWNTTKNFFKQRQDLLHPKNAVRFVSYNAGLDGNYNLCHFWSNFEIASLKWWRSQEYLDYFNHLDDTGNFFLERWGDAPVHSLAVSLMLPRDRIHFFSDIGYQHTVAARCPSDYETVGKCVCPDNIKFTNTDNAAWSCMNDWRASDPKSTIFSSTTTSVANKFSQFEIKMLRAGISWLEDIRRKKNEWRILVYGVLGAYGSAVRYRF